MWKLAAINSIITKQLKLWFRNPFLIVISIGPLIVIALILPAFLAGAESMPGAIIQLDNDPIAAEIKEYAKEMKSGTGLPWFEIQDLDQQETIKQFENGKLAFYVIIPVNISRLLDADEIVVLDVQINNGNDDVTKNVKQRFQHLCNHFNEIFDKGQLTLSNPVISITGLVKPDISFKDYVISTVTALSIVMSSTVNIATVKFS